jgi:hypothetical protein
MRVGRIEISLISPGMSSAERFFESVPNDNTSAGNLPSKVIAASIVQTDSSRMPVISCGILKPVVLSCTGLVDSSLMITTSRPSNSSASEPERTKTHSSAFLAHRTRLFVEYLNAYRMHKWSCIRNRANECSSSTRSVLPPSTQSLLLQVHCGPQVHSSSGRQKGWKKV